MMDKMLYCGCVNPGRSDKNHDSYAPTHESVPFLPGERSSRGFFTPAAQTVLHTTASAQVGGVEHTDERTLIDAGRARCAISQDAQKVGINGVKSKATGFSIGAVADTEYLTQHRTNKDGTANRTGAGWSITPTPAMALC